MGEELIFEDVNFDVEFPDSSPESYFARNRSEWLLWYINAFTREEKQELSRISDFCIINNTLIIPHPELAALQISTTRSTLVKRLIQSGLCLVNKDDITLIKRNFTEKNVRDHIHEMETYYRNLANRIPSDEKTFPGGEFVKFPPGMKITVEYSKLHMIDFESEDVNKKIIEVKFDDVNLPGMLFPAYSLNNLKESIKNKIVYHISSFAGDKADYFSTRILHNRELFLGKRGNFSETSIPESADKSSKNYRKNYTLTLLKEFVKSDVNFLNLILDLETNSSNFILTRYSYSESQDFDFLQTLHLARELFQKETEVTDVTIHSLVSNVMDDIKLYVTEEELKWMIIGPGSNFPESKYAGIYEKFLEEYVYKPGKTGAPKILKYTIPAVTGGAETILIHIVNLSRMLNISMEKASKIMPEDIISSWKGSIFAYNFKREMFYRKDFQTLIHEYLVKNFHLMSSLMRKPSLYRVLENVKDITALVDRLRMYEPGELDRVFNLNHEILYKKAYDELLLELKGFKKILFRIFHWFSRRKARKKHAQTKPDSRSEPETLEDIDELNSEEESERLTLEQTRDSQDGLWSRLPEGKIPKDEVDNNLSADVHVFLQERNRTPFASLKLVAETSVNNILNKAPFLSAYKKTLIDYCMARIKYIILKNPHHRDKVIF